MCMNYFIKVSVFIGVYLNTPSRAIKDRTCLNVPGILYFLDKGAPPTRTIYDILRNAQFLKEKEKTLR
ncbi:hypothetical protein ZWY2020_047298 [Hordeum vulgare]|nr:hypothetical protein ZWY2020_047298 [Hordeum vulgare]